jgi:gas vesicle protein
MAKEYSESQYQYANVLGVITGLVMGSLAGAAAMLLLAPQSGEKTRLLIQEKGIELRDQTSDMLDEVMAQVRHDGKQITVEGRNKAKQLLQQGQTLVAEQLDHVSDAAAAGKKAIQNS